MSFKIANGLSYVQVDKHAWFYYFIPLIISIDLAYHDIFRAKVEKGGINSISKFDNLLISPA